MEWITHIITFFVGLGAGWSIRVVFSSRKQIGNSSVNSNNHTVTQTGNSVTNGSIVGGNQDRSH
ncbi:hypothetical protein WL886_21805 [Escherichia coli]|jgi:hypothetical protein|uniref:hypothetical protein n=1 Tax=Escherichia TaxID=561 RepID=UPI0002A46ACD|nr:hypothetical protein [Escherichia coli]EEZ8614728.1 hypothetical protein [Escherichia coli O160]EAB1086900.1 hypothetical protein [Escherichia coli]EEV5758455.1 hypothetical protein [Escherichia coli]EEV6641193.1 hypothetical protein [Escherichia coli]EEV6706559.1 hypothetical protein [Escherichia coli]